MAKHFMAKDEVTLKREGDLLRGVLLPGAYPGVTINKCTLPKGKRHDPALFADTQKSQIFFFTKGKGYIGTEHCAHNISEEAVFVPLFNSEKIFIYAASELEFLEILVDLSPQDTANLRKIRMTLPHFSLLSDCMRYEEDFKGPGLISYGIIRNRFLGRASLGAVVGTGPNVNGEHRHDNLEQWYFGLEGTSFDYRAGGETFKVHEGDLTYTTKGVPHSSIAGPDEIMKYVWFELMS